MAKFKDLLVHQYGDIDDKRVYTIINHDLRDLQDYVAQVSKFVNEAMEREGQEA